MRYWLMVLATVFSGSLAAQIVATPGLSFDVIVHEPTQAQVGPRIAGITENNPSFPGVPGAPEFTNVYGNGKGYSNELDRVNRTFYAIGGTSTHDLAVLRNDTGGDISIDFSTNIEGFDLANSRPKFDNPAAPEQSSPDPAAPQNLYCYVNGAVDPLVIPNGGTAPVFLIRTKWRQSLDTSPRDYIWTFRFFDLNSGTTMFVEGDLLVPPVGGSNPTGCATNNGPHRGLWLLAGGALVAYISRRKLLQRA